MPSPLLLVLLLLAVSSRITEALSSISDVRSAIHHLSATPPKTSVQELANLSIPRWDGGEILAYQSAASGNNDNGVVLLIHEFFGLTQTICDKADAIARDVGCTVVAPDTYRGDSSTFIPKCIWLALSTPQERVNDDLDDVLLHLEISPNNKKLAVMGFCYGGGKALRYTIDRQNDAATVVCYGSPVTDVTQLQKLNKPLCGVFGGSDAQFPAPLLAKFRTALTEAQVENNVRIYDGVGHAFWKDMEQIEKGDQPQLEAYQQVTSFLKEQFRRGGAKSRREPTC